MKNEKDYIFIGNKISIDVYNRLVEHSEATGRKKRSIIEDALNSYLSGEESKISEDKGRGHEPSIN